MIYTHAAAAILSGAVAATGAWQVQGWRYTGQIATIRAERSQAIAAAESAARATEQLLNAKNRRVANDYQVEKARRAADAAAAADALRLLQSAIATSSDPAADPATASGINDPRGAIAGQCAEALVRLDGHAKRLASKASALQQYAVQVCMMQPEFIAAPSN
jgi:hypothetical protein